MAILNLSFQPLKSAHFPLLIKWLNTPHVNKYWDNGTVWTTQLIKEKYASYVKGYKLVAGTKKSIHSFVICLKNSPIGYIQYYNLLDFPRDDCDLTALLKDTKFAFGQIAAIDLYLGEVEMLRKGIGFAALKQFLDEYIWKHFDACLVDPDETNKSAIFFYKKAGFISFKKIQQTVIMIACK